MSGPDHVSTPGEFFGLSTGTDGTSAPGTGGKGASDPATPNTNVFGGQNWLTTGAEHVGSASPVDVSSNDDGGPASATNPGYYLSSEGTHTPDITGTTASTNGSPTYAPIVGENPDSTGSGSGNVTHYGNGRS